MSIAGIAEHLTDKGASLRTTLDLRELNGTLKDKAPQEIMHWVVETAKRPIVLTNFRPRAVGFLHMVTRVKPDIPVIWIDTGYNTPATYRFVELLTERLGLDLHVYTSPVTAARRQAVRGEIPPLNTPEHDAFSREVKLEPFERALKEFKPDFWMNGIRHDQNAFRKTLDVVTAGPLGTLRAAPMFHLTELDVEEYIYEHKLPDNDDYFDPTKGEEHRECGLLLAK
jgi:phosphoadenosine phosphosulfate reductase